jgi:hypothetical protein
MRFPTTIFAFALVTALALHARADVAYEFTPDGNNRFDVIRMTVTPAAAPVPSLRYRLVSRDVDLKPGNSVPHYYRAMLNLTRDTENIRKKYKEEDINQWETAGHEGTSLRDLPLEKLRDVANSTLGAAGMHLAVATTSRECNWDLGIEDIRGPELVSVLLPEFQSARDLARMLTLRTRLEIAEHRYNEAVETMRQQYRLAHDVAQVPLLICGLVGIAIDSLSNAALVEFIANPDSPNMYWALTELTPSLANLQAAARFEMDFGARLFPYIHNAETTEHSAEEWNRLFTQALQDFGKAGGMVGDRGSTFILNDVGAGIAANGLALIGYPHAKERLIAAGMNRERVEKMAVGQVLAIYMERNYRNIAEEWEKIWYVPFADMPKIADALDKRLAAAHMLGTGTDREIIPLASLLLPSIQATRNAQVRLERQVAALRVIEALRLYAAEHNGELPDSLDKITSVSVPLNPATDKAFEYRLDGKTAMLTLPRSDGLDNGNCRFEIHIAGGTK